MHPATIDWAIMGLYFAFVLGVGMATSHFYWIGAIPAMVAWRARRRA